MLKKSKIILGALLGALSISTAALAGIITNTGTGTIGGVLLTVTEGVVTFDVQTFAVKKIAFDLNNDEIVTGAKVAKGQIIWMVLYVDNITPGQVSDLRLSDNLNLGPPDVNSFDYDSTFSWKTSPCPAGTCPAMVTSADKKTWFTNVEVWNVLSVGLDVLDTGSIVADLVTIGTNGVQLPVNMTANTRYAYRFKVKIN